MRLSEDVLVINHKQMYKVFFNQKPLILTFLHKTKYWCFLLYTTARYCELPSLCVSPGIFTTLRRINCGSIYTSASRWWKLGAMSAMKTGKSYDLQEWQMGFTKG